MHSGNGRVRLLSRNVGRHGGFILVAPGRSEDVAEARPLDIGGVFPALVVAVALESGTCGVGRTATAGGTDRGTDEDTGETYMYRKGNAGFWLTVLNASVTDPATTRRERLGVSLSVSGRVAIIGASGTVQNQVDSSGVAYLYGV